MYFIRYVFLFYYKFVEVFIKSAKNCERTESWTRCGGDKG